MRTGRGPCASVDDPNRRGSKRLLDLVVYGRSAARRCAEILTPGEKQRPLPVDAGDAALDRFDRLRHADGPIPTAALREELQRAMQGHAAVFRTGELPAEGIGTLTAAWAKHGGVKVGDRPLIWN